MCWRRTRRFAAAVRWRNRHVFVDEMQDVNPAQFRFLRLLVGDDPDLFVVGDPNQSVYGWNGADPSLLDRLPATFPGTRVLRLDENHRCSPQVVAGRVGRARAVRGGQPDEQPPRRRRPPGHRARHRCRRGPVGGPAGLDGPPAGAPVGRAGGARPYQRPAGRADRRAERRTGAVPAGRRLAWAGQRPPRPPDGLGHARRATGR